MKTRIATVLVEGETAAAASRLAREGRTRLGEIEPALLAFFPSHEHSLARMAYAPPTEFRGVTILGASSAGEFIEQRDAKGAVALFALAGDYRTFGGIGSGLKENPERAVREALDGLPRELNGYPYTTALLLLDPLAGNAEEVTLMTGAALGQHVRLAGGAAGDDLHMKAAWVASGARAASDAVAIGLIFSRTPLGVGVCHGHRPLSQPLKVTRAQGNVVREVDGRPAWQVWLEQTRAHAKAVGLDTSRMGREEECARLLRYEAGLAAGRDYKIRAPLARRADGSIDFACGIAEGAVIRITESIPAQQVASAREAARRARAQLGTQSVAGAI